MCTGRGSLATLHRVPSLFRRKSTDLVDDAVTAVTRRGDRRAVPGATPRARRTRGDAQAADRRRRAGRPEPPPLHQGGGSGSAPPGCGPRPRAGVPPRRRPPRPGPERLLARNVVDSRRTVGTWFFGGALIVLIGSNAADAAAGPAVSNVLWVALALGVVIDSVLISRKIKKLVRERFPKTDERMGSLYLYAIMRSITFRRMRAPAPGVKLGDKV